MSHRQIASSSDSSVAIAPPELAGVCTRMLQDHLNRLHAMGGHPNRTLHYDALLTALLLGFFDPTVQSLRTFDVRSVASDRFQEALPGNPRLARSTLSEAITQMPASALHPLMQELLKR